MESISKSKAIHDLGLHLFNNFDEIKSWGYTPDRPDKITGIKGSVTSGGAHLESNYDGVITGEMPDHKLNFDVEFQGLDVEIKASCIEHPDTTGKNKIVTGYPTSYNRMYTAHEIEHISDLIVVNILYRCEWTPTKTDYKVEKVFITDGAHINDMTPSGKRRIGRKKVASCIIEISKDQNHCTLMERNIEKVSKGEPDDLHIVGSF